MEWKTSLFDSSYELGLTDGEGSFCSFCFSNADEKNFVRLQVNVEINGNMFEYILPSTYNNLPNLKKIAEGFYLCCINFINPYGYISAY